MRIVIVEGLWRYDDRLERALFAAMKERFPKATVFPEHIWGCWPVEISRMKRFIDELALKYDDGTETLFVGHSMGGIFSCALDGRLNNTRMVGIVTICTPHAHLCGIFPHLLNADHRLTAPVLTFEANRDMLVWAGSRHSQSLEHTVLECDHRDDLIRDPKHLLRITEVVSKHFARRREK